VTTFAAVIANDPRAPAALGDASRRALALPGCGPVAGYAVEGFACAVAPSAGAGAIVVANGRVTVGDVRLEGADPALADHVAAAHAACVVAHGSAPNGLSGEFSFAHWDGPLRRFVALRDGLGTRKLYYARTRHALVVSNVLAAVRAHPGVPAALNSIAVASFLTHGWNVDPASTTFAGVLRLAPGTALVGGSGATRVVRHWALPEPELLAGLTDTEYQERYRDILRMAVRDRVSADGTVMLLSGGLDSTSIAASIAPEVRRRSVHAVTYVSRGLDDADEARLAAAVAAALGLRHRVAEITPVGLDAARPQTPEPLDEPAFGVEVRRLAELATLAHVAIEGEDGDALFQPPGLATMLRRGAGATIRSAIRYVVRERARPYLGFWLRRRLLFWRRNEARAPAWLAARYAGRGMVREPAAPAHPSRPEAAARLARSLWQSVHDGCSVEYTGVPMVYRWPLLDTRVIGYVFSVPPIPWCQRKHLARRAFCADLPPEVIARPKTTITGAFERIVAEWRARTPMVRVELCEATREFVEPALLGASLRSSDPEVVMAGWRALQFDAWVRGVDAA
jgi:asparagine synthase (glutamine-hydrolysing)